MDLKKNILDAIKEVEIKIGYREEDMELYYPKPSLLELLSTDEEHLAQEIGLFCAEAGKDLGEVTVAETKEPGRYCVRISSAGVRYVHEKITASPFLTVFLQEVHKPGKKIADILSIFRQFSEDVETEQAGEREWAVYFRDTQIDPYVYYLEEEAFGLQYHRFTRQAYHLFEE